MIHEGAVLCVLCEFHKQECTFVQSPLPRKRKVVDGEKKESPGATKKRYVSTPNAHTYEPIDPLVVKHVSMDLSIFGLRRVHQPRHRVSYRREPR